MDLTHLLVQARPSPHNLSYRPDIFMASPDFPHRPIRVGIVGLSANGGWAAEAHVPALAALEGFQLRALSASSAESAHAAGEKYGVGLTFGSAEELAASPEVDLVVVTVKAPRHEEVITPALNAGKMVLSEWPLGANLAQAQGLTALAKARGVRTAIGLQHRCAPPLRYLHDLIANGYLGRVLSTTLVASFDAWAVRTNPEGKYMWVKANGANMLTLVFGHAVDALSGMLGEFTELSATMRNLVPEYSDDSTGQVLTKDTEDQIAVTGVLECGAVAAVQVKDSAGRGSPFRWEITGTDGDVVITSDFWMNQLTLSGRQRSTDTFRPLPLPASYEQRIPQFAGRSAEPGYSVAYAYAQLLDDITNDTHHIPDFPHALRNHQLIEQVTHAADTGQRQTITPR
jgi:predicted dehydrogenase